MKNLKHTTGPMKNKFIIKDWAGNVPNFYLKHAPEFNAFDEAEDFLTDFLGDDYETDRGEYYICESNCEN